jgi:hypothetical protein
MLKNFTSGSLSDIAREKLITGKLKQRINKDKVMFDRKISQKKASKKKDTTAIDHSKNPFMTSDSRAMHKSGDCKPSTIGGRSQSIDATKKMRDKRKRSSECGGSFAHTASGKHMIRNVSDQFSHIKTVKTQPNAHTADMIKILRANTKNLN